MEDSNTDAAVNTQKIKHSKKNKKNKYLNYNTKLNLGKSMQSIQDEAPHALAVTAGAVGGIALKGFSPIAMPDYVAVMLGVASGCVAYQMSQGAGIADLQLYKQSIAAAIAGAVGLSYPVLGNEYLNVAAFTFVGDQVGNYFLN
jgi:hypothetical protein